MEGELAGPTVEMAFVRCLHQMEIERIRYILQSLFRARLYKVPQSNRSYHIEYMI